MTPELKDKLKELPKEPGVYFHKNKAGEIIYIGKAARLNNRVRQYFQKSRARDPKTEALCAEIHDTEWMVVESELEALFLEAEMIRRYMPQYNILLRDDKALSYIRIDYDSEYPTVSLTRRPLDDGARYFGPYFSSYSVKQALKILRKIFPYATKRMPMQKRATLHYHLGLDPGLEEGRTSLEEYRANLRKMMAVIKGRRSVVIRDIEKEMKTKARMQQFEEAAKLRNRLRYLKSLDQQIIFSDKEFMDISKDHALGELVSLLSLKKYPSRIEGYDVSHMQGTDVVASMVVFTNGVSNKGEYRKFKTKIDHNNDFYNMNETLKRRLTDKNIKNWGLPDVVLIDGGKGQLDAALRARDEQGKAKLVFIGLAKKREEIIVHNSLSNIEINRAELKRLHGFIQETKEFSIISLPDTSHVVKLLQRIRDESHRFAVSYHSTLKLKRQTQSLLDEIPGVGPVTKRKLLKKFGSLRNVKLASRAELEAVVPEKIASSILAALK